MGLTQLGAPNLPIIVGLASLLLINRHEISVGGPAQSSKDEYAAHNNNNNCTLLDRSGGLVTFIGEQLKRWEEYFTEHLNHELPVPSDDAPSAANPTPLYD